jgi:hypothetical protein
MQQWALFVDIEGFSQNYENNRQSLLWLGALMKGIYFIGKNSYSYEQNRIFAYQFGDGFFISGLYGLPSLQQPASIAIALLRYVLCSGGTAKAAICDGDSSDVIGCYPEEIQRAYSMAGGTEFALGEGLMGIQPVNGTGLVNTNKLLRAKNSLSGSLLLLPASKSRMLPDGVHFTNIGKLAAVDWLHATYPALEHLLTDAGLDLPKTDVLQKLILSYTKNNDLPSKWKRNTLASLNLLSRVRKTVWQLQPK